MNNPDTYTVEIRSNPLCLPLSFTVHTYVVCRHGEQATRLDVVGHIYGDHPAAIAQYMYKDVLPMDTGFRILPSLPTIGVGPRWPTTVCTSTSGEVGSPAHQLYSFLLSDDLLQYPYRDQYNMILGPNSNTFTQWVANKFPECELALPANAWGKNYQME